MRRTFSLDDTPCPARPQNAGLPAAGAAGDDDEDTANIDVTMALPDNEPFLSRHTRRAAEPKGLKQPPRRITNYVPPARPDSKEQPPLKTKRKLAADAPPEPKRQRHLQNQDPGDQHPAKNQKPDNARGAASRAEPERRPASHQQLHQEPQRQRSLLNQDPSDQHPAKNRKPDGARGATSRAEPERRPVSQPLQQEPLRSLIAIAPKAPSRRRVSAMLQERLQSQQQREQLSSEKDERARRSLPEPRPAQEAAASSRAVLAEKPRNVPAVPSAGINKQLPKQSQSNGTQGAPSHRPIFLHAVSLPQQDTALEKAAHPHSMSLAPKAAPTKASRSSGRSAASGSLRLKKRPKASIDSLPSPPALTQEEEEELVPPSEPLIPGVVSLHPTKKRRRLDPVLAEDIERCEMYEEAWISALESSVSQLLNHLLAKYSPAPVTKDRLSLRKELLAIYSSAPFPLIYNRVHASLLYGALSIAKHVLENSAAARLSGGSGGTGTGTGPSSAAQACGWGSDIGRREAFLELLVGSYEQATLVTALEVVVGREMFALAQPGDSKKQILLSYIERYLVWSEDILAGIPDPAQPKSRMGGHSNEDEDRGTPAWLLRRTLLRSLMLVLLLDKAKSRGALGRQCLFKKESRHKSSLAVLKSLGQLLLPSIGDMCKPLCHLNYTVETAQSPLSEFDYTIDNLATDLRDGVRLARVVEMLLHSSRRQSSPADLHDDEDWPLSIHLQYPASSRIQKTHNLSIVLSALAKAGGNPQQVAAEDVVDGHREKTLVLLWGLLSQWGFELLLDWDLVERETRRLWREASPPKAVPRTATDRRNHADLLRDWAGSVANKHGVAVANLTSSFADGRVFGLVLHEYGPYLPSHSNSSSSSSGCGGHGALKDKLRGIGCNPHFASLFHRNGGSMHSPKLVVAGLAYLCSRLMQPAVQVRAAMTIQRAYRESAFRANLHRRIRHLALAHECARAVNRKNAAVVIQRAYRQFLHIRIQKLLDSITAIQALCRAHLVRRSVPQFNDAVRTVQRRWRAIRETGYRRRIAVAKRAVAGIQAAARGYLARRDCSELRQSACLLQARWRVRLTARQRPEGASTPGRPCTSTCVPKTNSRTETDAAIVLQRAWRARARAGARAPLCTPTEAILIQSAWRGHLARKEAGPALRTIRRKVRSTVERGAKEEDTLGGRTRRALIAVKTSTKPEFARAITQLEEKTSLSRQCARIVAEDEDALLCILTHMETAATQLQRPLSSAATRTVLAASNTLARIAQVPDLCVLVAGRRPARGKDIFSVLLQVVDAAKNSPKNRELLVASLAALSSFASVDAVCQRMRARKKWAKKLVDTLQAVANPRKRRGAVADPTKSELLHALLALFRDV